MATLSIHAYLGCISFDWQSYLFNSSHCFNQLFTILHLNVKDERYLCLRYIQFYFERRQNNLSICNVFVNHLLLPKTVFLGQLLWYTHALPNTNFLVQQSPQIRPSQISKQNAFLVIWWFSCFRPFLWCVSLGSCHILFNYFKYRESRLFLDFPELFSHKWTFWLRRSSLQFEISFLSLCSHQNTYFTWTTSVVTLDTNIEISCPYHM